MPIVMSCLAMRRIVMSCFTMRMPLVSLSAYRLFHYAYASCFTMRLPIDSECHGHGLLQLG